MPMGGFKKMVREGLVEKTFAVIFENQGVAPRKEAKGFLQDCGAVLRGETTGLLAIHTHYLLLTRKDAGFDDGGVRGKTRDPRSADFPVPKEAQKFGASLILTNAAA